MPFAGSSGTCAKGPWLEANPHRATKSPQNIPLSPNLLQFYFPPFPEDLDAEGGSWLSSHPPRAGGCPILCPPQVLAGEALLPQHFCSGLGMALGISLGNDIERALSLPRKYRSRVLMAFH